MIFQFAEVKCILEVLKILNSRSSRYSEMFRRTKVSHTTLQYVLRELNQKEFIVKYDIGHQNVNYELTNKGKRLLANLLQLYQLVKD